MTSTADTLMEIRLRDALRAVADSRPVTGDLDDLRRRVGGRAVPPSGRGRDERNRRLLAAAVVVASLIASALTLGLRGGDEEDVRISDPVPPTGFYLPTGLGTEWELVAVNAVPVITERGIVREARFAAVSPTSSAQVSAEVVDLAGGGGPVRPRTSQAEEETDEEVTRGRGTTARTYRVSSARTAEGIRYVQVRAQRGDATLTLAGYDVDTEPLLVAADRWWESGGEALGLDPGLGLRREVDVTFPVAAGAPGSSSETGEPTLVRDTAVQISVRAPSGNLILVTLTPQGATARPTGIDDPDGGGAAGLAEDERPRRLDGEGIDGPAWIWDDRLSPRAVADLPGAQVDMVDLGDDAREVDPRPFDPEELRDLLVALELVGSERWATAVGDVDGGRGTLAPDLAAVPEPALTQPTTTAPVPDTGP